MQEPVRHLPNVASDVSRSARSKLKWQISLTLCDIPAQAVITASANAHVHSRSIRWTASCVRRQAINICFPTSRLDSSHSIRVAAGAVAMYVATMYAVSP